MGPLTRGALTVAAAALAGGLTGCGSSEPEPGSGSMATPADLGPAVDATAEPAAGPLTSQDALHSALLTAADLPIGFVTLPGTAGQDDGDAEVDTAQPTTNPTRCANVLDTIARQVQGASADAESNFSGPGFTSIDIDAASFPGNGAAEAFSTLQATLRACAVYTGTDADDITVDYRVEPLAMPTVGAASTAVRLVTTSDGFTLVSDAIIAIVDSTVLQVVATGPDPIDRSLLEALAHSSAERIRAAAPSG